MTRFINRYVQLLILAMAIGVLVPSCIYSRKTKERETRIEEHHD